VGNTGSRSERDRYGSRLGADLYSRQANGVVSLRLFDGRKLEPGRHLIQIERLQAAWASAYLTSVSNGLAK
jgi:hypothetical protein